MERIVCGIDSSSSGLDALRHVRDVLSRVAH